MNIRSVSEFSSFVGQARSASVGSKVTFEGDIAQQVSKAMAGWHGFRGKRHQNALAGGGAIGGIAFAPFAGLQTPDLQLRCYSH